MWIPSWLRSRTVALKRRRWDGSSTHPTVQFRPQLEKLEDRITPGGNNFLGGDVAQVSLAIDGNVTILSLPNGHVQLPVDPCLPGLLRAVLGGGTTVT